MSSNSRLNSEHDGQAVEVVGVAPGTRHQITEPFLRRLSISCSPKCRSGAVRQQNASARARRRLRLDPATLLEPLLNQLRAVDSALPVLSLKTMVQHQRQRAVHVGRARRRPDLLDARRARTVPRGSGRLRCQGAPCHAPDARDRRANGARRDAGDIMRQMLRESLGLRLPASCSGCCSPRRSHAS